MTSSTRQVYALAAACKWCGQVLTQFAPDGPFMVGKLAGLGYDRECPSAPNPDEGPMPNHEPGTPVVVNPRWQGGES